MHKPSVAGAGASVLLALISAATAAQPAWLDAYREPARRLIAEATSNRFAWERLAELGDLFGHRLSGSDSLDAAIRWVAEQMKRDGLEGMRLEPVKVPIGCAGRRVSSSSCRCGSRS